MNYDKIAHLLISIAKAKNAVLANDFLLKTAKALVIRAGYDVVKSSVDYSNNQEITSFTIN